ncbi:unnamed protein product, partial [Strongylus vulgaris]
MNVYVDEGERLLHMYHIYQQFAAGTPQQRLLAVTDHNIYVINQNIVLEDSALPGSYEEGGHRNVFYEVHVVISLPTVDYIGVSRDAQVLILYAKSGLPFRVKTEAEGIKDKTCAIATGDVQLGNAIVKAITTAAESGNHEPPAVFTESTPYSLILKRYLTKELNGAPHIELQHFALVYWKEVVQPNWWRKPPAEWVQSYFVLKGTKMYLFTDSSCKEGELIINLWDCTEILELDAKKDCQWGFELVLPNGNLQLQCPSKDEMIKWMRLVNEAMNSQNDDDAAACMIMITEAQFVVAQEGEKCYSDGFIRTLVSFPLSDIRKGWIVRTDTHMALVLRVDAMYHWFFFRSETELDRIIKSLSIYPISIMEIDQHSQRCTMQHPPRQKSKLSYDKGRCVPVGWKPLVVDARVRSYIYARAKRTCLEARDREAQRRAAEEKQREREKMRERVDEDLEACEAELERVKARRDELAAEKHECFTKLKACLQRESMQKKADDERKRRV